jgi:hydrogenase 3 maturation protease
MHVTLNMCWQNQLKEAILRLWVDGTAPRVAVLGIGNQLRGDDVAGILIARALKQNAVYGERLLVINAGIAPESVFGELRRFDPDLVLIIDVAQMGVEPGSVRCIDPQCTTGFSFSTHTLPPSVLCAYIATEMSSQVAILGIQPVDISFGAPLSPIVRESLVAILPALVEILKPILQTTAALCVQDDFPLSLSKQSLGKASYWLQAR